ncbi:DNA gyrase/topoisomerase IV subunit A [Bifidobacterium longum]|uniref:DNA topoisomerase (ATP-hydrolyzing) n=2 Tax=Bifidobacterium longum subsp. infantis TaxID=1682 RepID=A0ABM9R3X6_BIFLI|nr:DNA topoisomerase IV subunit A [Bifidobacterium longum]ACJ52065.1 DNA gyrase/topoisomerase IV, subunit A [Bifidobacterium longum subsp. infantis ATCC 15697 = JCM 1222 = DSM 20088]MBX4248978.1 DNA topoisomerase IV subunit A [Bifidobacterium longum subsp. infantis]CEE97338.1 DNA gyrase subunit A [Bifidobacterium longum subsp. infantis]CEE99602.1 DNA gyrase subunit A [Bifidobacterium longum subsp. infantis]CEF00466.1 DNA gyrase subunit A [Bifidobacterium longum subsp. infantis]
MASHRKPSAQTYDPRTVKEHIVETPLNEEMSKSFLEYAYSVIYARALPDARDGLKPVQRRIVYQMGEMNLTPDHPYMKSARVVGEVMGKLHPHGDSAIYEAMVRLAQPFAMRLPLVDGHGNFGSLDDGPAASRYTEARLGPAALGMNADIDEDTVDFTPNYDNKLKEPTVLPAAIPNLLVNGGSGIAVGMATNLATHNLGEVVNAAKFLMAHSDATLEQLMRYVPGPDWPTGGTIIGRDGIREAYATGRGTFTTRAATHIEHVTARKQAIVVTELPYMVGPEKVIERISDGVKNRKLEGISGAFDLTDRHNGTRIVIEIKTGFDPHAVLVQLFKHTPLQDNFAMNNVALVEGRPHTMGLKEMLQVWVDHRRVVIRRRSEYRKKKALERLHLVEGLLLAMLDIDEVIQVIRTSDDADAAKSRLMVVFDLDEVQAQYILDLRLRRLTKMNRIELEAERDDLKKRIEELTRILASAEALDQVVTDEMDEAVAKWGSPRRTVLLDADPDGTLTPVVAQGAGASGVSKSALEAVKAATTISSAEADVAAAAAAAKKTGEQSALTGALKIEDEPCVVMMSATGLIARTTPSAMDVFNARSASDERLRDDQITTIFETSTRATYGLVTSAGRLVLAHVVDLPALPAAATLSLKGGVQADELIGMTESTDPIRGERVITAIAMEQPTSGKASAKDESEDGGAAEAKPLPSLAIGTRNGVIKRWNREAPTTMDSWPVIDLKDGDEVVFAAVAEDDDRLVFISSDSSLLTFEAKNVRPQGRTAGGMAGIKLAEGARVAAFNVVPAGKVAWTYEEGENGLTSGSGAVVLTVAGDSDALPGTENGAAKVTPLEMYPTKGRATGGVRSQRFLKGQNTLILAWVGLYPLHASTSAGSPVELPKPDMRRDGSGVDLASPIAFIA